MEEIVEVLGDSLVALFINIGILVTFFMILLNI
jgi:hypothetical protein